MGNLTLPWWGGEFEPEVSNSNFFLAGAFQTHVVVSEHEAILREIKLKYIAFVSEWLTEKGLTRLCSVFEGMYE